MIAVAESNIEYKWLNRIYKPQLRNFHKLMLGFCKAMGIPQNFRSYLNYGEGYVSQTYETLYTAPKFYLVNSIAFSDYYNQLDHDFQNDIMTYKEYKEIQSRLRVNIELAEFLHNLMGDDSIL
jgi:hypothetical protein